MKKLTAPHIALFFILLFFIGMGLLFFNLSLVDDSYINFRYAENLAVHGELNWNLGETPPVEGYSNFLWIALLALFIKLGGEVIFLSKIAGIAFGVGAIVVIYLLAKKMTSSTFFSLFPALLLAATIPFSFWSTSGMETTMFLFFLLLAAFSFVSVFLVEEKAASWRIPPPWKIPLASAAFALAALTRHEGLIVFLISGAFLFLLQLYRTRAMRRAISIAGRFLLFFLLFYLPYFAWRVFYYGGLFPNSFHAKKYLFAGIGDIFYGLLYMFPVIIFILFTLREHFRENTGKTKKNVVNINGAASAFIASKLYFFVIIIAFLAILLNLKTIIGYNFRFMLPTFPFFYLLAVPQHTAKKDFLLKAAALLLVVWVLGFGFFPYNTLAKNVLTHANDEKRFMQSYESVGKQLAKLPAHDTITLAVGEAGVIPYYSKMKVIDLLALNDRHLSRYPVDAEYVLQRKPDIILISCFSVDGCESTGFPIYAALLRHAGFQENYVLLKQTALKQTEGFQIFVRKEGRLFGMSGRIADNSSLSNDMLPSNKPPSNNTIA